MGKIPTIENTRLATQPEIERYLAEVMPIQNELDKKVPFKYQSKIVLKTDIEKMPVKFRRIYLDLVEKMRVVKEKHGIINSVGNDMRKFK